MCNCAETNDRQKLSPAEIDEHLNQARVLRERLGRGFEMIWDSQAGKERKQLKTYFKYLAKEYLTHLARAAASPYDAIRCPDCPNRGKGVLWEIKGTPVLCDVPCPGPTTSEAGQ